METTRRIGRNQPCPCGSGKKYKRCHGKPADIPMTPKLPPGFIAKVRKWHEEVVRGPERYAEKHGHGRPPLVITFQGAKMVAVGGEIYRQDPEFSTGFPNFIRDHGWMTVGEKWMLDEGAKPFEDRHQLAKWFHIHTTHAQKHFDAGIPVTPIGAGAAWMRFAYDLYQIRHNAKLEKLLLARLLDKRRFQGARYELSVAATFVSAGFEIEFEDETDNSTDHPEFIATDKFSSTKLAVEAKSKHRKGVYEFPDGLDERPGAQVNVRGLLADALSLKTLLPYVICVDVNLPPFSNEGDHPRWLDEINATSNDAEMVTYGPKDFPANCILFTNEPSHYVLEQHPIDADAAALWAGYYEATTPKTPCSIPDLGERLRKAYFQRSTLPDDFPKFADSGYKP